MARIMVVASANVDRIWWLDRQLVPGGRLLCRSVEKRYGGGGFNTGSALLALGHEVVLVTSLCDDEEGRAYLQALGDRGFITDFIRLVPGRTTPAEILIEPDGERTIIGHGGARKPGIDALPPVDASLVYLNTKSLGPKAIRHLNDCAFVISQFPLSGDRRPADVMIGSRSDMTGPPETDWQAAADVAGARLRTFVVTNGREPVEIVDGHARIRVEIPEPLPVRDATGAGDFFAAGYIDAVVGGLDPQQAALAGCRVAASWLSPDADRRRMSANGQ
jgi:sugar/nucleoside kinase (ribokinase family)